MRSPEKLPSLGAKLELGFTVEDAITNIENTGQGRTILDLYQFVHDNFPEGFPGDNGLFRDRNATIDGLCKALKEKSHIPEERLYKLLSSENPADSHEEEILKVGRYRDALTMFRMSYMAGSNLPEGIRENLNADPSEKTDDPNPFIFYDETKKHRGYKQLDTWAYGDGELAYNTPLEITPDIEKYIRRSYDRFESLLTFTTARGEIDLCEV